MKKQLTYDELVTLLRRRIKECGSQKDFAAMAGISAQYVSDVLHRRREPGQAILDALELQRVVTYREKD